MNALQRASIEKAGHDNGWEVTLSKSLESVTLGSSQHSGRVTVECDAVGEVVNCRFSVQACLTELAQNFPSVVFLPEGFCTLPAEHLPSLLRRAAQLLRSLPTAPEEQYRKQVAEVLSADPAILTTEAEAIVKRRIGQNLFRQALMDYWGGQCAVTGVAIPEVLRASHCKPWADCATDAERLDVYNGLLLTANLDALFDQGIKQQCRNQIGSLLCAEALIVDARLCDMRCCFINNATRWGINLALSHSRILELLVVYDRS